MIKSVLRFEGLMVLVLSVVLFQSAHHSWLLFAVLLFTPDLAMIGYLVNNKVGAASYNAVHTYVLPIILYMIGLYYDSSVIEALSLIWTAHIGMDRVLGYGLKYSTGFKDTHLHRI